MTKNKNTNNNPEYGVDSKYKSKNESKLEGAKLMEARLERMKNLSSAEIAHAQLMQLEFNKLEHY